MLLEWLQYLTTPCPAEARRLGALREAIAIGARRRRLGRAWTPHLENCRRLIVEAADLAPERRTALVLGSGLLLDIPLEALAERFRIVILADLLHLPPVRRRARRLGNVELAELDLTGALPTVWRACRTGDPAALAAAPPDLFLDRRPDLVVSANLLSQLPVLPLARLRETPAGQDEAALDRFARALIESHLAWLRSFPGVVCLITDVTSRLTWADGDVEEEDLLHGADLGLSGRSWEWNIAPSPEIAPGQDYSRLVIGVPSIQAG